jgi:Tol biopolymer transport system component
MIRELRVLIPPVLLVGAIAVGSWGSPAGAVTSCTITQVTDTADTGNFSNTGPVISADGTKIAFESDQDHTGFNADGNQEIVLYDITEDDFVRVSATTGGTFANRAPAISRDGSRVVWSTDRSIVGGNLDLNREIVRWTRIGLFSATSYVTNSVSPVSNRGPVTDDAGDDIVYTAGMDSGSDLFHFRTTGAVTTQLTATIDGESVQPFLNPSGTHVVFASNGVVDEIDAEGGYEILLWDLDEGVASMVTDVESDADSLSPVMNDDTRRVAFVSSAPFVGQAEQEKSQVVLFQRSGPFVSFLSPGEPGQFGIGAVAMNARSTRMVFDSDGDHTGDNADGNFEIFVRDFGPTGEQITQITDDPGAGSGEVDIDGSGTRIVFSSRGDHAGSNADGGREIFLATCAPPPPAATCSGVLATVDLARGQSPTPFADVIRGTADADTVNARAGNDVFCGRGGDDVFTGGPGADRASGGRGNDVLRGQKGDDTLRGDRGNDRLVGGKGPDTCAGGRGTDTARGCTVTTGVP